VDSLIGVELVLGMLTVLVSELTALLGHGGLMTQAGLVTIQLRVEVVQHQWLADLLTGVRSLLVLVVLLVVLTALPSEKQISHKYPNRRILNVCSNI